jgi:hypothetical protein
LHDYVAITYREDTLLHADAVLTQQHKPIAPLAR